MCPVLFCRMSYLVLLLYSASLSLSLTLSATCLSMAAVSYTHHPPPHTLPNVISYNCTCLLPFMNFAQHCVTTSPPPTSLPPFLLLYKLSQNSLSLGILNNYYFSCSLALSLYAVYSNNVVYQPNKRQPSCKHLYSV